MIILLTSCKNNKEYREALRKTWLKDAAPFPYMFIIGGANENYKENDILYVKSKDDYDSVPEKQFEALKYCLENFQFDNIFLCDDDAYVRMDRLLDCDYHLYDYYGGGPVRMWDKPYYALGGPGIILSKRAIKEIVKNGEKYLYQPIPHNVAICNVTDENRYWGDRFIGITLDKAGISPYYDERFVDINFDPLIGKPKQYNNIISYHGKSKIPKIEVLPHHIEEMHQHFQDPLKPIRVAMVLDQWSMGGAEKEFADMIIDSNPEKIQYVGIALSIAWEFYIREDLKGKLPPFHTWEKRGYDRAIHKEYLNLHDSFEEAICAATKEADVIIKWHTLNRFLENIKKPSILLCNATSWYTETKYKRVFADKYVGNSKWSTDWLPKQAKDRLVIYSGHSEDRVIPVSGRDNFRETKGFNKDDKIVSHIGRINLDKNIKNLCKAVSLLPEDWKLLLVGNIPSFHQKELYEILKKYIPTKYKLVHWTDNIGDAFAASDVFVLSSYYEGFSNALAEAWMSKTPTVFSRCGSADELIEKYGNIGIDIPTNSTVEELAEAIVKAPLNKEGVTNAYNMIKTFTKEKSARNWERCLTETCYNRSKLKVGLLVSDLSVGGLGTWLENLVKYTSRGEIEYVIIKTKSPRVNILDFFRGLSEYCEIHIEEGEHEQSFIYNLKKLLDQFKKIELSGNYGDEEETNTIRKKVKENIDNLSKFNNIHSYKNCSELIENSVKDLDAIIACGIESLSSFVSGLNIPVIMYSCYTDKKNIDILKNTCHLGTNFVAASNTTNIFPKEIQNSVSIINNATKDFIVDKNKEEMRISWGVESDDILIGFIDRDEYLENPLLLAKAINKLPEKYKAVFIGLDWKLNKLAKDNKEDLVKSSFRETLNEMLPSDKYIICQSPRNLADCYNALDVIFVSRSEGFGLSILETWMMKKPLVCTNVGIYKELSELTDRVLGIEINLSDSDENLSTAIKKALKIKDEDLQSLKDLIFDKFNISNFINNWVNLIQKSVDNFKNFHKPLIEPDPYFEIFELIKKHKTPKRVARKLNVMKFPLPEGEKEWTYKLVERYLS